jgi:aminoglycoside phosphotransferase (APT) family kinase protein
VTPTAPTLESDFDLLASPVLREALPGLPPALDATSAAPEIERSLLRSGATVVACRPGKALYLGADGCGVRYDLEVRDADGRRRRHLVLGRVLPDDASSARYQEAVIALADSVDASRRDPSLGGWAALPGRLVVHPFPIDPELPTLLGAADPSTVSSLCGVAIEGFGDAQVELGHYGRRNRCVLRYEVDGRGTVYGKVWSDDRGAVVSETMEQLRGGLGPAAVPRVYAYVPELRLALLAALTGAPRLSTSLKEASPDAARLVGDAAAVASALHSTDLPVAAVRSIDTELEEMRAHLALVQALTPTLAAVLGPVLEQVTAAAVATTALPPVPTHGDFTPSQLLSDGVGCGLVDFDSVAVAEAALDLGQYLAYLRLAAAKAERPADALARQFLDDYAAFAGMGAPDALLARTRVYSCVSLLRTTVHAWQKLKPRRAAMVFAPLAEEVAWLSAVT